MSSEKETSNTLENINEEVEDGNANNEAKAETAQEEADDLLVSVDAGDEPFSNFRHVMTEGILDTEANDSVTPSSSNLSQRKTNVEPASKTDSYEYFHSLPAEVPESLRAKVKKTSIFDKLKQADSKMILTMSFLVVAAIISVTTAFKLITSIPLVPASAGGSALDSFEVTPHASDREIARFLSNFDMEIPGVTPSLVWMFGFPQSGAAYIFHLIHVITKTATATNFGHSVMDLKGIVHVAKHDSYRVYGTGGPALLSANILDVPDKRILTWASADGACRNCHPRKYMYNYARFRELCWEGSILDNGQQVAVKYNPEYVKSAVHLFRDPFDNIVLRFWAEREEMQILGHNTWLKRYPSSSDGFQTWCNDRDAEWYDVEKAWYGEDTMKMAEGVICRQEFYKYIMFHNNVVRTRQTYNLPTFLLKYEDLYLDYEETIGKLIEFLDLPTVRDPPPRDMEVGFSAPYFTEENREATNLFMMSLALPKVASILKQYEKTELDIEKTLHSYH